MERPQERSRLSAKLWVLMVGVDEAPSLRQCDLSASGLFFEVNRPIRELKQRELKQRELKQIGGFGEIGEIGSIQQLQLSSADRVCSIAVMARLNRCATLDSVGRSPRIGVAFELLPESAEKQEALQALIAHLSQQRKRPVDSADLPAATVFQLAVHELSLITSWPVQPGEIVQLVFKSPGTQSKIPFEGKVKAVQLLAPGRHQLQVDVKHVGKRAEPEASTAEGISESVDLIFSALLDDQPTRKEHLVGMLSRIQLPSLLSLLNMEQSSGTLRLKLGNAKVIVYLSKGAIVDVSSEPPSEEDPRALLAEALAWRGGTFNFSEGPIEREDRLKTSTMSLLLDLAREADERKR